ncbi:MAG: 2-C-methyl-D-erythritol 2,4-cyclodiphosphate synthase [archaeon]|nr:2-C-methyl-D-erythritol 2,4-cyclodiphosphate synthase [archaeon]
MFRTGFGLDSHKFEEKKTKPLILGGIVVEFEKSLQAHSDGDVVLHSIFNAISSALGGRSIGFYHPDKIAEKENTPSHLYLETVKKMLKEKNFEIANLSIMIECREPKIESIADKMKTSIAKHLNISEEQIAILATSGEELSAFGKGEGIQVYSTVLIEKSEPKDQIPPREMKA